MVRRFYIIRYAGARKTGQWDIPKVRPAYFGNRYWLPAAVLSIKLAWSIFIFFKLSMGKYAMCPAP
jgi:hypothetical protein